MSFSATESTQPTVPSPPHTTSLYRSGSSAHFCTLHCNRSVAYDNNHRGYRHVCESYARNAARACATAPTKVGWGVGDARCFGTLGNQTKDLVLGEDLALGKLHKNTYK